MKAHAVNKNMCWGFCLFSCFLIHRAAADFWWAVQWFIYHQKKSVSTCIRLLLPVWLWPLDGVNAVNVPSRWTNLGKSYVVLLVGTNTSSLLLLMSCAHYENRAECAWLASSWCVKFRIYYDNVFGANLKVKMSTCWEKVPLLTLRSQIAVEVDFFKQASSLFASVTPKKMQVKIRAHNLYFSFNVSNRGRFKGRSKDPSRLKEG